jgi:hypothetical protein
VKSEALGWFNNEGTVIHWVSAVGGFWVLTDWKSLNASQWMCG